MMRIRCPNCDSTHEVPPSVLEGKPRKVRCASCRTVFEARAESDSPPAKPTIAPAIPPASAAIAGGAATSFALPDSDDALIGDAGVTAAEAAPEPGEATFAAAEDPGFDMEAAMGQDDLDALFADDAPATGQPEPVAMAAPPAAPEEATDPLGDGQDAAKIAATLAAASAAAAAAASEDEPKLRKRSPHAKPARSSFRIGPALGVVAATGIGTLVGLTVFRHETVRIAPSFAPYFEMMGLEVNSTGLEIREVRSYVVMEDHREMLEISGHIFNITRTRQNVPVIRLSLHNAEGQQIYVWTGAADNAELAAGEKTQFRRRLASPPKEATQVMVRFVARDDIVAAIR
jgi:predicted Zn finger-like uncharacterized protein